MKLKTLLAVYAAAAIVICLDFLVVPGFWITCTASRRVAGVSCP
ncbi:hypothetical protein BH20GEM1_BH20GEM1_00290 [soil metagenome]